MFLLGKGFLLQWFPPTLSEECQKLGFQRVTIRRGIAFW